MNLNYSCSVISVMWIVTKLLKLESRSFYYKVVLYFSFFMISFTMKCKKEALELKRPIGVNHHVRWHFLALLFLENSIQVRRSQLITDKKFLNIVFIEY